MFTNKQALRFGLRRSSNTLGFAGLLGFLLLATAPVFAQFDTGTITGTIADSSGAVIPNATVTVTHVETATHTTLKSDNAGNFVASALPYGHYVVSATAATFGTSATKPLVLNVGATVNVSLTLAVATTAQTFEVTGTTTTVDTSSSTAGSTLDSHQVANLPVNGRDVSDFLEISPGSVDSTAFFQGSVNGLDNIFTGLNITVDGQAANRGDVNGFLQTEGQEGARVTRASVDSVQEIDFANSGYSAESGFSLGPQMNIITKSGTNNFHGTLFEYLRNDALDARDYFNSTGPVQPLKLNQFGGSLGGPITRNRLFFFVNYEGDRTHLTSLNPRYEVPSAYVRSKFVPSMQPILGMMAPLPSGCGLGSTVATCAYDTNSLDVTDITQYDLIFRPASLPNDVREDTGSARIDYQITDNDRLMLRYNINDSLTSYQYGTNQGQVSPQALRTQLGKIDETHIFSPTLLNEIGLSVNRFYSNTASNTGTPYFSIQGFFTNLGSLPGAQSFNQTNANTLPEFSDRVTKTAGAHTLKFGTQIRLNRLNTWLRPIETYSYASFGDLENNNPFALQKQGTPGSIDNRSSNWDVYAQDDWRVTHRFTLNVGLRYDYNTTWNVAGKQQRNFDFATQTFGPVGQSAYSAPGIDFAPRVGFAWDPTGHGKTVFHGYGGLFYMPMQPSPNTLADNMPQNASINDNVFDVLFGLLPSIAYPTLNPALLPINQNVFIFPTNPRDPVSTNWLFGVEQEVAPNTVLTVNYTGNRVQHTQAGVAFQAVNLNPSNPNTNVNRRLAAQGVPYQNENYLPNNLFSKYNALQAKLRRNMNRLTLEANYAWSHEIDDEVNVFAGFSNPLNPSLDRGDGDWDVRNNFTASAVYDFPDLKGSRRLKQETLGGWQASSILQTRSGLAQNVEVTSGFFGNFMRPDRVPGTSPKVAGAHWPNSSYNLSAFTLEPGFDGVFGDPSTIGNVGRNTLRGPEFFQWDLSGMKNFALTERVNLQFRADIFNILNHPNFSNIDTGICSAVLYNTVPPPPGQQIAACIPNTPHPATHSGFGTASATIAGADGSQIGNGTNRQTQLSLRILF